MPADGQLVDRPDDPPCDDPAPGKGAGVGDVAGAGAVVAGGVVARVDEDPDPVPEVPPEDVAGTGAVSVGAGRGTGVVVVVVPSDGIVTGDDGTGTEVEPGNVNDPPVTSDTRLAVAGVDVLFADGPTASAGRASTCVATARSDVDCAVAMAVAGPPLQTELAAGLGAGAGVDAGEGESEGAAGGGTGAQPGEPMLTGGAISPFHADAEYVFFGVADADAAKAAASPTATTPTRTRCVTRERMRVRAPAGSPRSARRRRHCAGFAEAADRTVRTRATALIAGFALHQLCHSGTHGTWPNHIDRPPVCICVSRR